MGNDDHGDHDEQALALEEQLELGDLDDKHEIGYYLFEEKWKEDGEN